MFPAPMIFAEMFLRKSITLLDAFVKSIRQVSKSQSNP